MIKRPLCTICVLFLIVQAVRVCLFGQAEDLNPSPLEQAVSVDSAVSLSGRVAEIEEKTQVRAVHLKDCIVSVAERSVREENLLVYIRPEQLEETIKIGNIVSVAGEAAPFEEARNPGNFDQRSYYRIQGLHVLVWAESIRVESIETNRPAEALARLRSAWKETLVSHLGEYYGNTMSAILLGEKSGLDPEMKKIYQKNGISHILAISGLHMSFIGMGIYSLLRRAGLSFLGAGIIGGMILMLYTLMIGAGVSAARALIMFLVRVGADITGRDYDLPTSLALSAAILCARQPLYLLDAGFQLSFGALLGIVVPNPVMGELLGCGIFRRRHRELERKEKRAPSGSRGRIRRKMNPHIRRFLLGIMEGLASSMAVNLLLLGPLLYFYYELPPWSVILNLFVIPVMPLVMGAGLAGSALTLISGPVGGAILQIAGLLLRGYDLACGAAGGLPGSRIVTGRPEILWIIVYYAGISMGTAAFVLLLRKRERAEDLMELRNLQEEDWRQGSLQGRIPVSTAERKEVKFPDWQVRLPGAWLLLFAGVMVLACRMGNREIGSVTATVLDVGQGDCIVIRGTSGETWMVDGGSSDVSSPGTYRIEPYLLANGIDTISYVFITHGDEDHISGIAELLEDQNLGVRIRNLVFPPEEYLDEKLINLIETARRNGTRTVVMEAGQQLTDGEIGVDRTGENDGTNGMAVSAGKQDKVMTVTCLAPETGAGIEPGNQASLVLALRFGEFDMLLTGDVEGEGEKSLIRSGRLESTDILKAAHHGSKNSGSEDFLRTVQPSAAIISAGADNRYGHPHKETLERLEEIGCTIYSTQDHGTITVKSDGKIVEITGFLD